MSRFASQPTKNLFQIKNHTYINVIVDFVSENLPMQLQAVKYKTVGIIFYFFLKVII